MENTLVALTLDCNLKFKKKRVVFGKKLANITNTHKSISRPKLVSMIMSEEVKLCEANTSKVAILSRHRGAKVADEDQNILLVRGERRREEVPFSTANCTTMATRSS